MTKKHSVRLGKYRVPLPASQLLRICIGVILILGGFLGFLPLLGFWMVPMGLVVLSVDLPIARRQRRRVEGGEGGPQGCPDAQRKMRPGGYPGPKALGNGGVSSRKTPGA